LIAFACPTIANRRGSGEVAAKIQAPIIAAKSYRAGARVIVLTHFAEGFVCSDARHAPDYGGNLARPVGGTALQSVRYEKPTDS
jgi:hypothetical protein